MMQTEDKRAVAGSHLHMMTMRIDRRGFILVPGLLAAAWCLEGKALARGDAVHDAVRDHVLYELENNGERASTREIVQRIVVGGEWSLSSPFTQAFRAEHGHNPERARASWNERSRPPISQKLLESVNDITEALPLFSEADPKLRLIASKTRIAHNHWVLQAVCNKFAPKNRRRESALASMEACASGPSTTTTRGVVAALRVLQYHAP